jgi:signal transduction histidine kinase
MKELKDWIRQDLWDRVPISIAVVNREFEIVEANSDFREHYGEWKNRPCYEVYKNRSEPCTACAASKTFEDGQMRVNEETGSVREGQQTYYIVHMVPLVLDNGGIPYVIEMSTDITELKKLEKEKLEAERFAVVGQSVAGLAHGIKNLITGLEGGLYLLKSGKDKGDAERVARGWQMLEKNTDHISTFVKRLLGFSRERKSEIHLVSPESLVVEVTKLFEERANELGIELESRVEEGIEPAPLDEEGVHCCLSNLISNALEACESSDKDDLKVTVSAYEKNGTLLFAVEDNGTGMDSETQERIFKKFFTTKRPDKGTGIGLMTTRKITHEHGGGVSFESEDGKGSVFRLEFPRSTLPGVKPKVS